MSEQIEEIFKKYKDTFLYRKDEMRDFLIKHFEKAFKEQLIEDVQRIDSSERIKTARFQKELSAWRNSYRNIILSTCVELKNEQKRYDYKFLFVEEKLDEETIEIIENAIDEASRLRRQFKFDESIEKIDDMIELIRNEEDALFNKRLYDARREILSSKENFDKKMEQITKIGNRLKANQKNDKLEEVISDCEKIIEIADSIKKGDIKRKYLKILEETQNEVRSLNEIKRLEKRVNLHRANGNFDDALKNCEEIIEITETIKRQKLIEKFYQLKDEIEKELEISREKYEKSLKEIKELEEQINNEIEETEAIKYKEPTKQDLLLEKAKEIGEIIEIEENVLPLVEEFSVDDILGDLSNDIDESLEQIGLLLNEHRVEVRKEITNKSILTSISGEVVEIEKNIEIQEPEEEGEKLIYSVQSEISNPFKDVIEEAIILDLIPYNFEIMKVDLNGELVKELPDNTLEEDGIELRWKLQNIQPKEKIEIKYDLRRRISRTIIFLLKNQLKIIKTHSNLKTLELEGLYEARLPFSNSYGSVLNGVIVEDIIPLYYLHFIKEPTKILPAEITSSKQGDLIKWNVGTMEAETLNYHYKLLELYKFEELKIAINNLDNEGFDALTENNLIEAISKYKEVINLLIDYVK